MTEVAEILLSKCEAQSSNVSTANTKTKSIPCTTEKKHWEK
jgi:hypothetical protein